MSASVHHAPILRQFPLLILWPSSSLGTSWRHRQLSSRRTCHAEPRSHWPADYRMATGVGPPLISGREAEEVLRVQFEVAVYGLERPLLLHHMAYWLRVS